MDKLTYLAELAEGLARWVPERERQDILRYYAEYFDEAGPDKEGQVVAELGDPWALSCRLAVEGGYVTQQAADSWTPRQHKRKLGPLVAVAIVACVAIVAVSVARTAASVGGWIGRLVSGNTANVAQVEEGTGFVTIPGLDGEYIEGTEYVGGFWNAADNTLAAFQEIDVDASIANVTVTGGDDYTLSIGSDATLGGYSLKWEIKNGVLNIRDAGPAGHVEINSWDDFKNIFGVNASAMDVVITIPEGAVLNKLQVKTGLGDVFLSNLDVEKTLEAKTGMGDVECYEIRAYDDVKLESGMGDVTLAVTEPYSGTEFDLKTGMGTIEAQIVGLEKDWNYEAKTGMGNVTLNGDSRGTKVERKGTGDYKLNAETGMGDVNLYFQDGKW